MKYYECPVCEEKIVVKGSNIHHHYRNKLVAFLQNQDYATSKEVSLDGIKRDPFWINDFQWSKLDILALGVDEILCVEVAVSEQYGTMYRKYQAIQDWIQDKSGRIILFIPHKYCDQQFSVFDNYTSDMGFKPKSYKEISQFVLKKWKAFGIYTEIWDENIF